MELDELSQIAYRYGTDKCPQLNHPYTPFYYDMFKNKRNEIKKVIEAGIGYHKGMSSDSETIYVEKLGITYHKGASLKMWRDFFPNAQIYGFDYRAETMLESKRIKTFQLDERKQLDIEKLILSTGNDIDLFIDDASHRFEDQIRLCKWVMPLLNKNVIYIIEDIKLDRRGEIALALSDYEVQMARPKSPFKKGHKTHMIFIVKHKGTQNGI